MWAPIYWRYFFLMFDLNIYSRHQEVRRNLHFEEHFLNTKDSRHVSYINRNSLLSPAVLYSVYYTSQDIMANMKIAKRMKIELWNLFALPFIWNVLMTRR